MRNFNIQPLSDELGPNDGMFCMMPIEEFQGEELEWKQTVEFNEIELTPPKSSKVKFDEASSQKSSKKFTESVLSEDLFEEGLDDI